MAMRREQPDARAKAMWRRGQVDPRGSGTNEEEYAAVCRVLPASEGWQVGTRQAEAGPNDILVRAPDASEWIIWRARYVFHAKNYGEDRDLARHLPNISDAAKAVRNSVHAASGRPDPIGTSDADLADAALILRQCEGWHLAEVTDPDGRSWIAVEAPNGSSWAIWREAGKFSALNLWGEAPAAIKGHVSAAVAAAHLRAFVGVALVELSTLPRVLPAPA